MVPRLFRGVQEVKGTSVWSTHPHSQQLELQQSLKQLTEAIYGTYALSFLSHTSIKGQHVDLHMHSFRSSLNQNANCRE